MCASQNRICRLSDNLSYRFAVSVLRDILQKRRSFLRFLQMGNVLQVPLQKEVKECNV